MNRPMCLIIVGLCIAGMVLIAGCTQETPPETTPTSTPTLTPTAELPTEVPNITSTEQTPTGEMTPQQTGNQT